MRKFGNKLVAKLLGAIAISFLVSLGMMALIILSNVYLQKMNYLKEFSIRSSYFMILLQFSAAILTFIAVFFIMARKKILYLKLITESVHHIANGKLGLTIRIESRDELTRLAQNINDMSKELEKSLNTKDS